MKTPPLLLGAALFFWGWQTGFLWIAVVMAAVLEGSRWIKARWEFSEEDFTRIWVFCTLLFLAAAVLAFTTNEGPGEYRGFFQNPTAVTSRGATNATSRSAAALFRWTPMLFFLFVAAPAYSEREGVPLRTISIILGWRWKRARKLGLPAPPDRTVNISYPYFALCLFAASVHTGEGNLFFWGLCILLAWGLWPLRSPRYRPLTWAVVLLVALLLGYTGQHGIGRLQNYLSNINPQWLSGFGRHGTDVRETQTQIGMVGRLKLSGKIVLRLQTKQGFPPALLREASYRVFKGRNIWDAEIADRDYQPIQSETNGTTFVLIRDKTNTADVVSIGCYLDGGHGVLPLPAGSSRLENLMAYEVERNGLGAVLVRQGPGLVLFDACYGPGATMDDPPNDLFDLQVPSRETNALGQVAAEIGLDQLSPAEKVRAVMAFFKGKFTYRMWQPPPRWNRTNETALTRFLLRTRSGHCEYFATAATLLLRHAGVRARYALGFSVHEGAHGKFVVRERDAHAWCLVWDEQKQLWRDFDPTPPSWVAIEGERASPLQRLSDGWSRVVFEFSKFRWGQSKWRQYLLWALVPMLGVLLYRIVFRRRRRQPAASSGSAPVWPGLDSEFYQVEQKLAARGLARLPSEPLSEWLTRVRRTSVAPDLEARLESLLHLHYRYRFDPVGLDPQDRDSLRREARSIGAGIQ